MERLRITAKDNQFVKDAAGLLESAKRRREAGMLFDGRGSSMYGWFAQRFCAKDAVLYRTGSAEISGRG